MIKIKTMKMSEKNIEEIATAIYHGRKKVLIQLEGAELLIHSLPKCQRAGTETQQFTYAQLKAREVAKSFNM
tara:strand:- start:229 stop:444 length:216 start_codon:yes stop_codon:yes gene_type:complete